MLTTDLEIIMNRNTVACLSPVMKKALFNVQVQSDPISFSMAW